MLKLYETFQQWKVPETLEGEVFNTNGQSLSTIDNFSKVNIFIGANNSGKSKLMREMIKSVPVPYHGKKNWEKISSIINEVFDTITQLIRSVFNRSDNFTIGSGQTILIDTKQIGEWKKEFTKNAPNYNLDIVITILQTQFAPLKQIPFHNNSFYFKHSDTFHTAITFNEGNKLIEQLKFINDYVNEKITELKKFKFSPIVESSGISRIYIPSIRTLRNFALSADVRSQTIKEYDFKGNTSVYNGQDLPKEVRRLTNSKESNRKILYQFETLLSETFFSPHKVKLTYSDDEEVLLIKIGNEIEKPIHELGDGLQMIIIMTFPFFIYPAGIIAIEEPELFIHPGLQKIFTKFLTSHPKTKDFQIYLATHSNHIIDSINHSNLISLFSIQKKGKIKDESGEKNPDLIIDNLAHGNENFLNLLGVTTTSVYLSNCTVWVEGITDRLYIQKFISVYLESSHLQGRYKVCKEFKEGIHYSFALTGGDSIIHWDFSDEAEYLENTKEIIVKKFCSRSLIIVDSDFGKNPTRKSLLKTLLKERFIQLSKPEIENFLSAQVIKSTLMTYPSVQKSVASGTLPEVSTSLFSTKKVGYIIDSVLLKGLDTKRFGNKKGSTASLKSGDKFIFCNKALQFINEKTLIKEAIQLTEKILDFIMVQNKLN